MNQWLSRVVVALIVLLGPALPTASSLAAPTPLTGSQRQDPKTITVYVTRTGEKYHRDGCRCLSRSQIAMSLAEAARRFGPCSVCKPPVIGTSGGDR